MCSNRDGNVQMFNQEQAPGTQWKGMWDWNHFSESNLFEVQDFHSFLDLHNYYVGTHTNAGFLSIDTFEAVQDRLRRHLEKIDRLHSIQCLVDMDSAWGAFSSELITYLNEECPHAELTLLGNDYPYASSTVPSDALFKDRTKQTSRTCLNIVSSLLAISEHAHLIIPIAMSPDTIPSARFPEWQLDRSDRCHLSQLVAVSLQTVGFHARAQLIPPAPYKFCELAIQAPISHAETVLAQIAQNETGHINVLQDRHSLLPCLRKRASAHSVGWRKTIFRGFDSKQLESRDFQQLNIESSPKPLLLPQQWLPQFPRTINSVAECTVSKRIAFYLQNLSMQMETLDRRIVHEYVQNGMETDRIFELKEELASHAELYNSIK